MTNILVFLGICGLTGGFSSHSAIDRAIAYSHSTTELLAFGSPRDRVGWLKTWFLLRNGFLIKLTHRTHQKQPLGGLQLAQF
ncbi:MAG: hypothetical protein VKK42_03775 [Lyngbya sp.]|nr:hypothetical protein [Lyngbya sp.]